MTTNKNIKYSFEPLNLFFYRTTEGYKKDREEEMIQNDKNKKNHIHTFLWNDKKIAIVGVYFVTDKSFVTLTIHQDYRGKNLAGVCIKLISNKYNIKVLYAGIDNNNIASRKCAKKIGFKRTEESKLLYKPTNFKRIDEFQNGLSKELILKVDVDDMVIDLNTININ